MKKKWKLKGNAFELKVQIRAPQFRLIIQNDLKVGKIKQLMLILLHTHTKNKEYRVGGKLRRSNNKLALLQIFTLNILYSNHVLNVNR